MHQNGQDLSKERCSGRKPFQGFYLNCYCFTQVCNHFYKIKKRCVKTKCLGFFLNSFFSLCYSYWKDLPISHLNIFTASSYSFTLLLLPFGIATPFPSFLAFAFQDVFLGRKHYCHSSLALLKQTSQILSVHSRKTDHPDL